MEAPFVADTLVKTSLAGKRQLPLVVEPSGNDHSLASLKLWLHENNYTVRQWLVEYGAILLRGFEMGTAQEFEDVAKLINPALENDYLGTSPRNAISQYVHSASELPDYYPIMQHCEMSFLHCPPANLFFFCKTAPAKDGETPIVDFRKVYEQLDAVILEEFIKKGVRTIRNYNGPKTPGGLDLWKLKRWDEMFQTSDKAKVEDTCRKHLIECQWLPKDRLRLLNYQLATIKHPVTGQRVWFNHTQVFHLAAAAIEYKYIAQRQKNMRSDFYGLVTTAMTALKRLAVKPEQQAMHCTFGDGSPIPDAYIHQLQKVIWDNMSFFNWKKGDLLAIDNYSTSHGRMPYAGPREIYVCWSAATLPAGYHYVSQ